MHLVPIRAVRQAFVICVWLVAGVGLLVIGLWNAKLIYSENGFYAMSYLMSLFAAVAVQKNIRDLAPFKAQAAAGDQA